MRGLLSIIMLCAILGGWPQASGAATTPRAGGPGFAPLQAGSMYAGGDTTAQGQRRVELYLLDGNYFVLRQIATPKGKEAFVRDMTGHWRQSDGGALLRLSNRHGLALGLNVGGGGNLYGDFFPLPDEKSQSLVLKKSAFRAVTFTIMGSLERGTLTDSSTGRAFSVSGKADVLAKVDAEKALFVDAEVTQTEKGLRIERIRSSSTRFPSEAQGAPSAQEFSASVEGKTWLLPVLPGFPTGACFFNGSKGSGSLEVTGKGLRLVVPYTLRGNDLTVTVSEDDVQKLRAVGAEILVNMLRTVRSWSLESGALVLAAAEGQSFLLEKATPRGTMFSRTPRPTR